MPMTVVSNGFFDDHDQILGGRIRPPKGCITFIIWCDAVRTLGWTRLVAAVVIDASIAGAPDNSEMFACHKYTALLLLLLLLLL